MLTTSGAQHAADDVLVTSSVPLPSAVSMRAVGKSFGDVPALQNLDLVAPVGRITVLLGPNGAGKTTAVRVMTGAMSPDSGLIRTLGHDPDRHGEHIRASIGVVSAKPALYDRLSGTDNLVYAARLHGVASSFIDSRIAEAAGRFGIGHALDKQVGGYSTGMKTRLALARSVLHEPELLLFDEPTSGLDPESAQAVLALIREMTRDGRTVIMCTHHLVEAEGLADHVVVLDAGTDLVAGSPDALVHQYWPDELVDISIGAGTASTVGLEMISGVRSVQQTAEGVRVVIDNQSVTPDIVAALVRAGIRVTRVAPREPSLEELYFAVRRTARDLGEARLSAEVSR